MHSEVFSLHVDRSSNPYRCTFDFSCSVVSYYAIVEPRDHVIVPLSFLLPLTLCLLFHGHFGGSSTFGTADIC